MFDTPVFKKLAHNDTGAAVGHQGGFVIPKDIEGFFPDVAGAISAIKPTVDVPIRANLIVDGVLVDQVETRYQYQSWGGTRFERRLTANLGALRKKAIAGDFVLFARDLEDGDRFIITLFRQGTSEYAEFSKIVGGKRWGVVPGLPRPMSNRDIRDAEHEIEVISAGEFAMFDDTRRVVQAPVLKKARGAAFRRKLLRAYGANCLASGEIIITPNELTNLDAAHIVPIEVGGSDDIRNGLLLSKDLHWAFDKGLFSLSDDYSILVSDFAQRSISCEALKRIDGANLRFGEALLRPHADAIRWHRNNAFID